MVANLAVCPTEYNSAAFDEEMATPRSSKKDEHALHDFSYGISSDPLTQFAVVFGALIQYVALDRETMRRPR